MAYRMIKEAVRNKETDSIDATQRLLEDEKSDSQVKIRSGTATHDSNLRLYLHKDTLTFKTYS